MNRIQYKNVKSIAVVQSTYGTVKYLIDKNKKLRTRPEDLESNENAPLSLATPKYMKLKKKNGSLSSTHGRLLTKIQQDTLYIINGGMGLNNSSIEQFIHSFALINDWLNKNNIHVGIIRGANDDPSLFKKKPINFSNVKMYDDCTVASIEDTNILCIGGGCSIDKSWKLNKEKYSTYRMYYGSEEHPTFSLGHITDFIENNEITLVVTALAPTFVGESYNSMKSNKWLKNDNESLEEINMQRSRMDELYTMLVKYGKTPKRWFVLPSLSNSNFFNEYNDIGFAIQKFNEISNYRIESANNMKDDNLGSGKCSKKTISAFFGNAIEAQEQPRDNAFRFLDFNALR